MIGLANRLKTAAGRYAEYRKIVDEIEGMSTREANDLGISPSDARQIARSAVYGR
ncbi:MAG: DUF1127 domain-containing protein [Pseudomonadota bacterium]